MTPDNQSQNESANEIVAVRLEDLFDMEEIQQIQDSFAQQTGMASVITDIHGTPITNGSNFSHLCRDVIRVCPKGLANCMRSDAIIGRDNPAGPTVQRCLSGGLLDGGTSIHVDGKHIANWLIGQVRDEAMDDEKLLAYADEIGADKEAYKVALQQIPRMSLEKFTRVCETLHLFGSQLSKLASQNRRQAKLIADRERAEQEREHLVQELAAKNRELENVIYAASHDLRSPLLNIQGFSRYLEQDCSDLAKLLDEMHLPEECLRKTDPITRDQIPKAVKFISAGVIKMDTLIGGLLKISRLGQVELKCEILDMNQLLGQILLAIDFQIQEAGATLGISPLPPCAGDSMLVSQIFSNLIDNSLKYRDSSRPLKIEVSGRVESNSTVSCVSDNGKGIAREDQDKIWELFRRLDPAGPIRGEGLGLNLVRRIVERHKGNIRVKSAIGEGCKFYISLPNTIAASPGGGVRAA